MTSSSDGEQAHDGFGPELRARVARAVSDFQDAFDAASVADTPENRARLKDACDRLMRAAARVLLTAGTRDDG